MAAADLRDELSCSICRDIFTDPVSLPCGHNFCQGCIERTWDTQVETFLENPSCPECRQRFSRRPELTTDWRLRGMVERFCLTESIVESNCFVHDNVLEYFCCDDSVCVCATCCLAGQHRGHRVELLSEASERKKERLRNVLEKLRPKKERSERRVQRLQERRREVEEKIADETERVTALVRDMREQLEALEQRLLSDISSQKEKLSLPFNSLIQELEIRKAELSRKIRHIEELCNMADPVNVLQERESDGAAFCETEGADNEGSRERDDINIPAVGDLDVDLISETLLTGLAGIVTGVKGRIYGQEAPGLLLDKNTAHNNISVSGDMKSASYSGTDPRHPQTPERFQDYIQVLSSRSFPPGRHYWELEVSETADWRVGVAYPSIERRGYESWIGYNTKSWCLCRWNSNNNNKYTVTHDSRDTQLPHVPSCRRIRIWLDYEAGCLSFYELSEPIRHLHTFTAKFTEPLHTAFGIGVNASVRIIS